MRFKPNMASFTRALLYFNSRSKVTQTTRFIASREKSCLQTSNRCIYCRNHERKTQDPTSKPVPGTKRELHLRSRPRETRRKPRIATCAR